MNPANEPIGGKADLAAWLAVAAGTIGALMATLDISIVNSSLPTIQGEIGASGTEGTWIATGYLVAEIIIIPLSAWLERALGLRTFLLTAAILFTAFSVVCGSAGSLGMMIVGRVGQGLTGGAMIPTAQTIIATRLPPSQQPVGTALFALTAILGPVVGPLIGGWLTENISWHMAFFLNLPICIALVALLLIGLPHQSPDVDELKDADWLGIIGMSAFLGGLTVVLEEGQRELWFDSTFIRLLSSIAAAGGVLLLVGQRTARRPVIKMPLLFDRQFGSVASMSLVIGMVIYGTAYVIPQFLSAIAGYNAMQAGKVVLLSGVPSLMLPPLLPLVRRSVDIRLAVYWGLLLLALGCFFDSRLTPQTMGDAFTLSQLLRGSGMILSVLFLNQATIQSVSRDDAGDATGLFTGARNLGGSLALAAIATIQDQRMWLHARRLEETLTATNPVTGELEALRATAPDAFSSAVARLDGVIQTQALTMAYADIMWILAIGIVLVIPLVLFLRPLDATAAPALH